MTPDTKSRYSRLRSYMSENGLDAVYVTSAENFLYMSGYNNPDGYMLITHNASYAVSDFRYIEAAKEQSFEECTVCLSTDVELVELIKNDSIKSLGIEDMTLSVRDYNTLIESLEDTGCKTAPLGAMFSELRAVKDEYEIQSIISAQRIAEGAFKHLLSVLRHDMTEIEVAAELEYYMKKNGSEMPAFDTIAVSGSASSMPHGVPRNVKLERGFLTLDYGAKINGYCSDMTRTIVVGKADDEMRHLYNTVLRAQCAAIDAIAEGSDAGEMDKIARDIINTEGYEGRFGHSLGHGVGLLIHELPNQSVRCFGKLLVPGNVVTVEPGIYIEGKYGCRIEDMVAVTAGGSINLTECDKSLIEI